MAEVYFYHLTQRPLDQALPELLEKVLERGWKAVVRGRNRARLERLDTVLWTRRDADFLPHGMAGGDHDAEQPVLLTTETDTPNAADILLLVDGARADPAEAAGFARLCLMFDGNNAEELTSARADWKAVTASGLPAQYWAQDDGRWVKKAEAGK